MSLQPGTRLGPYEVLSPLGHGGMGEVYKARDTRLDRQVAIKVLRSDLAASTESRDRFEREAWAISRLSHPRVCALYDVGHVGDRFYLVMELIEGEALSARSAKGPMPIAEVLRIGAEIADALHAAHRQGIVHRDLKPANVMITSAGVKLVDFGLAKGVEGAPVTDPAGDPLTAGAPLTAEGAWLGTAPYMAPEQLLGRPVDARTDMFAFGAVLFELVAGRRAFAGATAPAIVSAIIHEDPPPVSSVRPDVPPALDRLIAECLAKDPDRRWQNAHDASLQLAAIQARQESVTIAPGSARRTLLVGALAAAVIGMAVGWGLRPGDRGAPPVARVELQIIPPERTTFSHSYDAVTFAVSPDGTELAFVSSEPKGVRRAWIRSLTALSSKPIAGTDGATSVFWAPDGQSVGFFASGVLKRADLVSGVAVPIGDVRERGTMTATWSPAGEILFASAEGDAIFTVSTSGGPASPLVTPDRSHGEARLLFPSFLPDGRRYLYLLRLLDGGAWIMLGEAGRPARRLLEAHSNVTFVDPGFLVFSREGTLVAQRVNPDDWTPVGESIAVASSVRFFLATGSASFSASRSGVIVYQSDRDRSHLAWVDRSGREMEAVGSPAEGLDVRISPDGRTALLTRALPSTGTLDIWSLDLGRGTETRLTLDDVGTETYPVLLPGGQEVIFSTPRGNAPRLVRKNLITSQESVMVPGVRFQIADDISPDGRLLAFNERTDRGTTNLFTLPLSGAATPSALRSSPFFEFGLRFSPDGHYYSFVSNESGRPEVYLAPMSGGTKVPVSKGGASTARWSRDGGELFYLSTDRRLMAVPVRTSPSLELGTPVPLFALDDRSWSDFDVSPDGRRFLALIPDLVADEQPLKAILNGLARR